MTKYIFYGEQAISISCEENCEYGICNTWIFMNVTVRYGRDFGPSDIQKIDY